MSAKQQASKLDQFAEQLAELEAEKKTLVEMQDWLKAEGVTVSLSRLSRYLDSQRSLKLQAQLLGQIATGARQVREVEKQFGQHPAPELETLIKLHRVLILQLSTQANADPSMVDAVNASMRTVMEFASARAKAELEKQKLSLQERRVALLEQKAAAFDKVKEAVNTGGLTPETLTKIERELKLL